MSRLFFAALLFSAVAMSFGTNNEVALDERAGFFFGIPIPDFISSIPILGNLLTQGAGLLTNTSTNVFGPALDIVSVVTSGALSKNSSLFQFVDGVLGNSLTALSAGSGFKLPVLDTGSLANILSNFVNSIGASSSTIFAPLFALLGIPGTAFGAILKQLMPALQGFIPSIQFGGATGGTMQSKSLEQLFSTGNKTK